jgi:hypothetical protein
MKGSTSEHFDAEIDLTLVKVKSGLGAVRNLRAALLDLAYALQTRPHHRGLLVLIETSISADRLHKEWDLAGETLRPEIIARLGILILEAGQFSGYPELPPKSFLSQLEHVVHRETNKAGRRLPRPDYDSEILKILVHYWLLKEKSLSNGRLQQASGCTYPTVAKSLKKLAPYLHRNSDRSFVLETFPRQAWSALLTQGDKLRHTVSFADRSGQPRLADDLGRRLKKLGRSDLAVGGVIGARAHYSGLDLAGTPRLDVTVHCPDQSLDLDFVARLDPGLAPVSTRDEPPVLVVHVLQRKENFFISAPSGGWYADPVECLLDLHEAHLEQQAAELFSSLAPTPAQL